MTTFMLIRHAAHSGGDSVLLGRTPGVHLSPEGSEQAQRLALRLRNTSLDAVYSSPIERARETAEPIARAHGIEVTECPALAELEYGEWSGRDFDDLGRLSHWEQWNVRRSLTAIPGGESMVEVQARVIPELRRLHETHPNGAIAAVTHGDVIRAAAAFFLGAPLDLSLRIQVEPASVTVLRLVDEMPIVQCVNAVEH